jgi:hypothetical protein
VSFAVAVAVMSSQKHVKILFRQHVLILFCSIDLHSPILESTNQEPFLKFKNCWVLPKELLTKFCYMR